MESDFLKLYKNKIKFKKDILLFSTGRWVLYQQLHLGSPMLNSITKLIGFASQVVQRQRIRLPMQEMQEIQVQSLGQEDHLEGEMETHSCILAWEIPWTGKPGGLRSMGSQRVRHD